MNKSLIVLLFLWGDDYISMLDNFSLPALLQSGNLGMLFDGVELLVYTIASKKQAVLEILARHTKSYPHISFNIDVLPSGEHFGLWATRRAAHAAFLSGCRMLWMTPDMIFGNGSINHMLQYAKDSVVTVSANDLRVNYHEMPKIVFPISNAKLVKLAFQFPHQCTITSINRSGSYMTGVSLSSVSPGLWSIVHKIPTPYLVYFTEDDIDFLDNWKEGIGLWDHVWPSRLVETGRLRHVGCSDMVFVLHLTSADHALAPVKLPDFSESFYRDNYLHHSVLGNYVGTLRESQD